MVRKIPTQVPQAMSRLLESTMARAPPTWYGAVLANPPPVLPPRQVIARNRPDATQRAFSDLEPAHFAQHHSHPHSKNHKQKHFKEIKPKPVAIYYEADKLRRQFFADFPFEALRPTSLVEGAEIADEHPIRGKEWTKLEQRGRYPSVEDTIQFALNVRDQSGCSLQDAYDRAVSEFVKLRAAHEMATQAAETEARYAGAQFKRDEWVSVAAEIFRELKLTPRPACSTLSVCGSRAPRLRTPTPDRLCASPPPASSTRSPRCGPATSTPTPSRPGNSPVLRPTSSDGLSLLRLAGPAPPSSPRATSSGQSGASPSSKVRMSSTTLSSWPRSWVKTRRRHINMQHSFTPGTHILPEAISLRVKRKQCCVAVVHWGAQNLICDCMKSRRTWSRSGSCKSVTACAASLLSNFNCMSMNEHEHIGNAMTCLVLSCGV